MSIDNTIAALVRRMKIEETLYRYSFAFDFEGGRDIGACFTPDAVAEFHDIIARGNADVAALLEKLRANYAPDEDTMHINTNLRIEELSSDDVHTTTYCMFYVKRPDQQEWCWRFGGYYDDLFTRVGEEWLIKRRRWLFSPVNPQA
jgi:hypothetical protein